MIFSPVLIWVKLLNCWFVVKAILVNAYSPIDAVQHNNKELAGTILSFVHASFDINWMVFVIFLPLLLISSTVNHGISLLLQNSSFVLSGVNPLRISKKCLTLTHVQLSGISNGSSSVIFLTSLPIFS